MPLNAAVPNAGSDVLDSLRSVCDARGLGELSARLVSMTQLVSGDMREVEADLATLPYSDNDIHASARHLISQGGKRLRPMCVALASRIGDGFGPAARDVAIAVELVHCATLLHDDVVDIGDQRRGAPAARTLFGNAASIFAGDWLLVEALRRVRRVRREGVMERLLDMIDEMISAEAMQLANRGRVDVHRDDYFRVVEGKTAALFRWAMYAGGRAGQLEEASCQALETFGRHLGVAFQLVDDLLDYDGDASVMGKALFVDLREGKTTYPVIVALERDPSIRFVLERLAGLADDAHEAPALRGALLEALRRTEAIEACRTLAWSHADDAVRSLATIPDSLAKGALLTVARATVHRTA